jgi:hypothetical protein
VSVVGVSTCLNNLKLIASEYPDSETLEDSRYLDIMKVENIHIWMFIEF